MPAILSLPIGFFAVRQVIDSHDPIFVINGIKHPIVSNPEPIFIIGAFEFSGLGGARIIFQSQDFAHHPGD